MKLRNKILAMAVVAVAGVNVYLANDVNARNSVLSLLNLENVAEADECFYQEIDNNGAITYNCYNTATRSCTIPKVGGGTTTCKGPKEVGGVVVD